MSENIIEKIVSLAKRRGFVYPGSEIYGGFEGTYDLGPLGVELANNIKREWWKVVVYQRDNVVGLDSSILLHPKVWEASGHVSSFNDSLIECKVCHERFRVDFKDLIEKHEKTHDKPAWTGPQDFNLMFKTQNAYLRPETAQGIFINFPNVIDSTRVRVPFGIAQIGKGFRNEITTGNFLFRVKEFEMLELEFFVKPGTDQKWHEYWKKERLDWYLKLGINKENIKVVDLPKEDIAHYSKGTAEVWYNWPFMGWGELEGIANRTDYDLKKHQEHSGKDFAYTDPETGEKYLPYVIEPSAGVGRVLLALLIDSYREVEDRKVLKLNPRLAPFKAAVFPLLANKEELVKKAHEVYSSLKRDFVIAWDDRGNIGKRYYYQDEIGTPYCLTVDFDSLKDESVTVRDRDTSEQERIKIKDLKTYLSQRLA